MGFGSAFKSAIGNIVKGTGNPLADFGRLVHEAYDAPGRDTAKALPARYRNTYRRNTRRALMGASGNTAAGIFDKSTREGYTDKEAATNAAMFGVGHSQVSAGAEERMASEKVQEANAAFERRQMAEDARARGQIAARVRRGTQRNSNTKSGTLLTGPQGLGSAGFGTFAALLGL